MAAASRQSEIEALLSLSARVGRNPLLVQASSGNTSIKIGGTLWIKGSGKWLARAMDEETLVPVDLEEARAGLSRNQAVQTSGASIETAMHAVLPHRVVIHVHSVNTISWAVRQDGPERVGERLAGLPWRWVPYTPSGLPLALAIRAVSGAAPCPDVFVLANHGLVVCGDSCAEAEELLNEVEGRLAVCPREMAEDRILQGGILYPCQAVFLGLNPLPRGGLTCSQLVVLDGLLEVVRRIDPGAPIRYLSEAEVEELLKCDAHGYVERTERNAAKEAAPWASQAAVRAGN